jgi:hypothetical protein
MISVLAEEIKGEVEKCERRRGRRPCSVAESSEEGGSSKDGKAEDKGRKETDSNSFSSFRCNAVRKLLPTIFCGSLYTHVNLITSAYANVLGFCSSLSRFPFGRIRNIKLLSAFR